MLEFIYISHVSGFSKIVKACREFESCLLADLDNTLSMTWSTKGRTLSCDGRICSSIEKIFAKNLRLGGISTVKPFTYVLGFRVYYALEDSMPAIESSAALAVAPLEDSSVNAGKLVYNIGNKIVLTENLEKKGIDKEIEKTLVEIVSRVMLSIFNEVYVKKNAYTGANAIYVDYMVYLAGASAIVYSVVALSKPVTGVPFFDTLLMNVGKVIEDTYLFHLTAETYDVRLLTVNDYPDIPVDKMYQRFLRDKKRLWDILFWTLPYHYGMIRRLTSIPMLYGRVGVK